MSQRGYCNTAGLPDLNETGLGHESHQLRHTVMCLIIRVLLECYGAGYIYILQLKEVLTRSITSHTQKTSAFDTTFQVKCTQFSDIDTVMLQDAITQ